MFTLQRLSLNQMENVYYNDKSNVFFSYRRGNQNKLSEYLLYIK